MNRTTATPTKPNGRAFYGNPCIHCGEATYTNTNDTYHTESGNIYCRRSANCFIYCDVTAEPFVNADGSTECRAVAPRTSSGTVAANGNQSASGNV